MGTEKHFRMGSFYRVDDRTGFPQRAENTRREWQGLIVGKRVWEARQPQDFVRGVNDIQTVPNARPRPTDVFIKTEATNQFTVYGDLPGNVSFEVQNGKFQVFGGTTGPVDPSKFPSGF